MELLIIAAAVMFIAGPAALGKLISAGRSAQKAKSDLSGAVGLEKLLGLGDAPEDTDDPVDPEDPPPDD